MPSPDATRTVFRRPVDRAAFCTSSGFLCFVISLCLSGAESLFVRRLGMGLPLLSWAAVVLLLLIPRRNYQTFLRCALLTPLLWWGFLVIPPVVWAFLFGSPLSGTFWVMFGNMPPFPSLRELAADASMMVPAVYANGCMREDEFLHEGSPAGARRASTEPGGAADRAPIG